MAEPIRYGDSWTPNGRTLADRFVVGHVDAGCVVGYYEYEGRPSREGRMKVSTLRRDWKKARSIDAAEEVAEGDERRWILDDDGPGHPYVKSGPQLNLVTVVVPEELLTAEREKRGQLERLLNEPGTVGVARLERDRERERREEMEEALDRIAALGQGASVWNRIARAALPDRGERG